jgi:membrane protease subunit (stomatin/prohibitin family)
MSLHDFLEKQFIKVIQWTESDQDTLAWRFPMRDMEIMNGGQLTVRESQASAFVNEGRIADIFAPGLYTLNTRTLPILTDLMNWSKEFKSPFKSDVYFFSTRIKTDQRWGTATPITIRDKEFGAVRLRGYGIYSWHIDNPRAFHTKVSGTRELYKIADLEGQLRNTIVGRMTGAFAESGVPFLDMAANQTELGAKIAEGLKPQFADLGLVLDSFVVENLSLPEELQKMLDTRVGMNMIGDMGRFTQYQVANSLPIAAGNESGGIAGIGVGLGAGMTMAQQMMNALNNPGGGAAPTGGQGGGATPPTPPPAAPGANPAPSTGGGPPAVPGAETKFCVDCGKSIPKRAKFCPECGAQQ